MHNELTQTKHNCHSYYKDILTRGGVEDTRLEAKDTKKIQGQGQPFRGQTLSRPRTGKLEAKDTSASALQKKKKRSSQKFFKRSPRKNVYQKIFQALHKILTFQKIVLSSSRGQANFRGLEASRPKPRTSKCVLEDSTSDSYNMYHEDIQIKCILNLLKFHYQTARGPI